ncbi:hypothetical protein EI94DRAFT_1704566 [Lactarius quietus]|nr:hypothetical protein EI94DRAFT_1704566 [Lactarius quietus]
MGRKTRGQLARAKSLKIARQTRLSELGRSVAGPSDDLEASYNDAGAEPEVTCPSGDLSPVNTENENALGARDTLASEDGEDGTDPSDLSDGLDLVENTALQTFASTLQEAQRLAIRLEREKESQKRRTPKTYRGDSKRTLYRREKARKALALQGFLDIRRKNGRAGVRRGDTTWSANLKALIPGVLSQDDRTRLLLLRWPIGCHLEAH